MIVRRAINNFTRKKLVKTTIHEDLYGVINNFRREYMKMSGRYINNSLATQMLAKRMAKIKPKFSTGGVFV